MSDQREPRKRQPNTRQLSDAELAERDEKIWQLRLRGLSLRQIGAEVGLSHPSVHEILKRGYQERVYPLVDEQRAVELERLDLWTVAAGEVLNREHIHVSNGRIVRDENDKPIRDDGPVLAAIDRLVRLAERRARLLGLDAPTRVQADVNTQESDAVRALAEEAARRVAGG